MIPLMGLFKHKDLHKVTNLKVICKLQKKKKFWKICSRRMIKSSECSQEADGHEVANWQLHLHVITNITVNRIAINTPSGLYYHIRLLLLSWLAVYHILLSLPGKNRSTETSTLRNVDDKASFWSSKSVMCSPTAFVVSFPPPFSFCLC